MSASALDNKTVLITGGTGSWGMELTRQLLEDHGPREIRIFSRGELKQVEMRRSVSDPRVKYIIGDVRDKDRLRLATKGVDVIFHLAALKHVPVCEENAWETVQTNVIGIQNIIEASIDNGVERVVDVSTDKAVDPFNLYGVTKACGEKLMIAANLLSDKTRFVCIRGGNVLGTTGSVVPLFKDQIRTQNSITITDPNMTRFIMRVEEAIHLVLHATEAAVGGEIYVMKMPAIKISDLAKVMIESLGRSDTEVREIGIRPGEKLYEVLVSRYEIRRTIETDNYFIILPQIGIDHLSERYSQEDLTSSTLEEFNSVNTQQLTNLELQLLLSLDGWLEEPRRRSSDMQLSGGADISRESDNESLIDLVKAPIDSRSAI